MANVYIFDDILTKGIRSGQVPGRTSESRNWYRKQARNFKQAWYHSTPTKLMATESKTTSISGLEPGRMFMFFYDPKHKKTLPYYDTFPLIFPFSTTENGFYGLNLHYLQPQLRAKLMDGLYDLTNNSKYDQTTKLNLSYKLLKGAAKTRWFKPCVKQYLNSHVKSRFLMIDSVEWDIALFLPVERFEKASKNKVWADSRKIING